MKNTLSFISRRHFLKSAGALAAFFTLFVAGGHGQALDPQRRLA